MTPIKDTTQYASKFYTCDACAAWHRSGYGKQDVSADILGSHIASFQVNSLTSALWNGPISAPPFPGNDEFLWE